MCQDCQEPTIPQGPKGEQGTQGDTGGPGSSIELRIFGSEIQWRQDDDNPSWTTLILLSDITGPQGAPGPQGDPGPPGSGGVFACTDSDNCLAAKTGFATGSVLYVEDNSPVTISWIDPNSLVTINFTFTYGIGAPGSTPNLGSIYLDTSTGCFYKYETGPIWNQIYCPNTAGFMLKSVYDTDDDGIVDNSELLNGDNAAFYLDRINHTGFQAQGTITGLAASLALKEDTANKNIAGGYCPLDIGGLVPLANLPFSGLTWKGVWNANTNTPAISDGCGGCLSGDWYKVSVGGTQDLGSGVITFVPGDWVLYNGAVWQKTSDSNLVTSVNGQIGVITLTTANVADSLDKRYVTDNYLAALAGTNGAPSGANKYVTDTDPRNTNSRAPNGPAGGQLGGTYPNPSVTGFTLPGQVQGSVPYFNGTNWVQLPPATAGQVLTTQGGAANPTWTTPSGGGPPIPVIGPMHIVENYSDGHVIGTGSTQTLSSLGYTAVSAATKWPQTFATFVVNTGTDTIDWICWQEAMLTMRNSPVSVVYSYGGKVYVFNRGVELPKVQNVGVNQRTHKFSYYFNGSRCKWSAPQPAPNFSPAVGQPTNNFLFFQRPPTSGVSEFGFGYDLFTNHFYDGRFGEYGFSNGGGGINLCWQAVGPTFTNCDFLQLDVGLDLQFCLHPRITNTWIQCNYYGIRCREGNWTGATVSATGTNAVYIQGVRIFQINGMIHGLSLTDCDSVSLQCISVEGQGGPQYSIFYDMRNTGAIRGNVVINDFRWEGWSSGAPPTRAMIGIKGYGVMLAVSDVRILNGAPGNHIFIEADQSSPGTSHYVTLKNVYYNNTGSVPRHFYRHIPTAGTPKWDFENVQFGTGVAPANSDWSLTNGGAVPPGANIRNRPLI